MSKKEIKVCVHIILGNKAQKFFDSFNKGDLIFRFPFALYIGISSLFLMLKWCFCIDDNEDPFIKPVENEDSIDD